MDPGLDRLLAARPALGRVALAGEVLGLVPYELLHAGPPLDDPCDPPAPLRSSVVMTALHEGWARSEAAAEAMLRAGRLTLLPAQERGCVTPLAAVVALGTPLVGVGDIGDTSAAGCVWAPVSPVRGADTRMGQRDPAVLGRLAERDATVAPALAAALGAGGALPLWPFAATGLAAGDDLHSRTAATNAAFVAALDRRVDPALAAAIAATPLFFLTIWMAACRSMLQALEGEPGSRLVCRAGGNGERFAISLAGRPGDWTATPAQPPQGSRLASAPPGVAVCPAIGDSAAIDLLGLGAQRLASAPEPLAAVAPWLPPEHATLAGRLFAAASPHAASLRLGLDARAVVREGVAPLVALAMVAADGRTGLLGRGVYRPPVSLFACAVEAADHADAAQDGAAASRRG